MTRGSKSFIRSVSILFTGTVVAQLISYLASPVITRQYSPEESAYLGLFLRITALGAAIATARLELAFPLEKEDHHAFGIYRFSMRFSIILSVIALLLLLIYSGVNGETTEDLLLFVSLPVGIFLTAFFNQGASWSLRKENYAVISSSSLILSGFTNGFKLLFGLFGGHFLFLIGATLLGYLLSLFSFLKDYLADKKTHLLTARSKRTKALITKNSDLYVYNLPHVFIDLGRDLLLASIVWNCYGKLEFGSYDHAFRMLKLPIIFIGAAIGQVLYRKCTALLHEQKELFPIVLRITLSLFLISFIPFFIVGLFGPHLFAFVFSEKWRMSGEFASIMVPWLFLNFMTSPISHLPILLKKQKSFFWLNLIGTLSMLFIVSIPYWGFIKLDFYDMLKLLSISQAAFLLYVLIWLLWLTKKADKKLISV